MPGPKTKRKISSWTLLRELKKLMSMKMTVILIVIGALSTVTKRLVQEFEVPVV